MQFLKVKAVEVKLMRVGNHHLNERYMFSNNH